MQKCFILDFIEQYTRFQYRDAIGYYNSHERFYTLESYALSDVLIVQLSLKDSANRKCDIQEDFKGRNQSCSLFKEYGEINSYAHLHS